MNCVIRFFKTPIPDSCVPCLNNGTRLADGSCSCKASNFGKSCECIYHKDQTRSVSIQQSKSNWDMFQCKEMREVFPKVSGGVLAECYIHVPLFV